MKLSKAVKPISYVKAHVSDIIHKVSENDETIIITLNGEARAVIQGIGAFEKTQESLAMLKILAQSKKSLEGGKIKAVKEAFETIRRKIRKMHRQ